MATSTGNAATIRVVLVDDQQLVRSGFAMMLSVEEDITVVAEAPNGAIALARARELRPDVILMDVQMPVMDGIEATRAIVAEDLAKVLILTTFDRDDYVFDGLTAGASGFLLKNYGPEQLIEAIRAVAEGHALLAPEVTRRVIAAMTQERGPGVSKHGMDVASSSATGPTPAVDRDRSPEQTGGQKHGRAHGIPGVSIDHLTEREREVLTLVARGLSNAEIARELFLGEATVKTHVSNCLAKLQVRDRVQLVVFAYEHGLAH